MGKPERDGAPSPVNPGDSATRQDVRLGGPPLGPGGEDITWPDQVAPRGRKASSTRKIKPQTSNLNEECLCSGTCSLLPCSGVPVLSHWPSSALVRDACAQTLAAFSVVCAQALTLFRIVEGYLWSDTHPLLPCSVCVCSGTCPLLPCCGVPVLRHSPSSALFWGACAPALPLLPLVVGCLCSGTRPLPPC